VRELLSDGRKRFCTPDKLAARKRASFIRATLQQATNRKPKECDSTSPPTASLFQAFTINTTDTQRRADIPSLALHGLSDTTTSDQPRQWLGHSCGGLSEPSACSDEWHRLSDSSFLSPKSSITPVTEDTPAATHDYRQDETSPMPVRDRFTSYSIDDTTNNRDSTVLIPSRRHKIRQVLSQKSFSSSMVSDLLSLMGKRFSLSTFETSSHRSFSTLPVAETETSFTEGKASEILDRLRQTTEKANLTLAKHCCIRNKDCRHRYIGRLTATNPHFTCLGDVEYKLQAANVEQPPNDSFGNSELFFAARIGAPADIILSLLNVTKNVNSINADGQTFLYFLDPLLSGRICGCQVHPSHPSKFECLIHKLERRRYNFDHLDNHGRHFLSFLLSSPSFNIQLLLDLMLRDNEWRQRVQRTAQLRDADGIFLIDFMALHPNFETIGEDVRSQFRPLFVHNPAQEGHSGVLSGEDDKGQTSLHQYLQREFLHTAPLHEVPLLFENASSDLNRYSCRGRTPTMDFLLQALEQNIDEDTICAKVQQLICCGANVNTRSRGGSTILHFAAKKAFPKLVETLLASDIQVDHCDNAGLSALDHASKAFNRSRSVKAPAELTARSLKSTAHLLSVMSHAIGKDRAGTDRTSSAGRPTKDFNERSLQILQRLIGQEGQRYPPSFPQNTQTGRETTEFESLHGYTKLVFPNENRAV
jgi:hypothetical protein